MSDIQERVKQYIDSRLMSGQTGYLGYYDGTAKRMKRRYMQTRSAAAIGAVLIPVVSNLPWELHLRRNDPYRGGWFVVYWFGRRAHPCT